MKQKFNIGDTVRVVSEFMIRKFPKCSDLIGIVTEYDELSSIPSFKIKFDESVEKIYPRINKASRGDCEHLWSISPKNMEHLKNTGWRPKKGELIEVSKEGNVFYSRNFRVFMDGLYWCEDEIQWLCNLNGYKFARPLKKAEQKFEVGDIVTDSLHKSKYIVMGISVPSGYNCKCIERGGGWVWKSEEILEKVPTIPIEDGKISFRGISKGIMVDKNIVMYYSHRYDIILISEAEKPLPKKYVWVKVDKSELKRGDIFTTDIFSKEYIFYNKSDCYSTTKDCPIQRLPFQGFSTTTKFYKVIEI